MEYNQVYKYTNEAVKEVLGETAVVNEDLSNIVDIGTQLFNANAVDKFVGALVDRIGKTIFVDRVYPSQAPKVLRDGWEFGQVLQKVDRKLPTAVVNETWELQNGTSYDPNIFYGASVKEKFYTKRNAFEIDQSLPQDQVKGAFENAETMGRFISRIFVKIGNAMTLRTDNLIKATINSAIASTYYADIGSAAAASTSGVKAVNLLKLYNDATGAGLTKDKALRDLEFLKFASEKIWQYSDYLTNYSTLFNINGEERFTPKELQHIVLLSEFKRCSEVYLQSPTYHDMLVSLPNSETVVYWQGSGTDYSFDSCSSIDVKTPAGNEVKISGLLGCIFDRDMLGVSNRHNRVLTNFNPKAEFYNYFYKWDAGYFNDENENMVIFFIA